MEEEKRTVVDELHRQARIHFKRRKYVQRGIGETLQADLVFIPYKDENRGYTYLLTVIDTFSKFALVEPLKSKTAAEVALAIEKILSRYRYKSSVKNFFTDKGSEFYNKPVKDLLKKNGIKLYSVYTSIKAGIVERFNRTLKLMCWKNFGYIGSYNWIDHIQALVKKYNSKYHRTIGMPPNKVTKRNEKDILLNVYNNNIKIKQKSPFKLGDYVRISDLTGTFRRGFQTRWSTMIFKIIKIKNTSPPTYLLQDAYGDVYERGFYKEELQRVKYPDVYLVEKILKKDNRGTKVRWLGFSPAYDSYV